MFIFKRSVLNAGSRQNVAIFLSPLENLAKIVHVVQFNKSLLAFVFVID